MLLVLVAAIQGYVRRFNIIFNDGRSFIRVEDMKERRKIVKRPFLGFVVLWLVLLVFI